MSTVILDFFSFKILLLLTVVKNKYNFTVFIVFILIYNTCKENHFLDIIKLYFMNVGEIIMKKKQSCDGDLHIFNFL